MKKSLKEYALIAEIASAIAIVASLLFVGYQIDQNNKTQTQTNTQAVVSDWVTTIEKLAESESLSCVYGKAIRDFNSLSSNERLRISAYWLSTFYVHQEMYFLVLDDAMEESIWNGYDSTITEVLGYPGVIQWFEVRKHWFSEEYQIFMNEKVNQNEITELIYYDDPICN